MKDELKAVLSLLDKLKSTQPTSIEEAEYLLNVIPYFEERAVELRTDIFE